MVAPENWYSGKLLDGIDLLADPAAQRAKVQKDLPGLHEELAEAAAFVAGALAPVPVNHPSENTWDDEIVFQRAINASGYGAKQTALAAAEAQLVELAGADNPGEHVARLVLGQAHAELKVRGLQDGAARSGSGPASLGGVPLAEVVWQARNQDQHWNEPSQPLYPPVVKVFAKIIASDPAAFGLQTPPADESALRAVLAQRTWAPVVLHLLGWTGSVEVAAGVKSIHP